MQLTKYEHACLVLEKEGKKVVVDPGGFTTNLVPPTDVVAIVITHEHPDHVNRDLIDKIFSLNPGVTVLGHESLTDQLQGLPFTAVEPGSGIAVGSFHFEFFGGEHAEIHPAIPHIANLGVMVNDTFYYPGDSFTLPEKPVNVLALPVSAPWLKLSEAIDFMLEVHPKTVFPTHDALSSANGDTIIDGLVGMFAEKNDIQYQRLSESVEI